MQSSRIAVLAFGLIILLAGFLPATPLWAQESDEADSSLPAAEQDPTAPDAPDDAPEAEAEADEPTPAERIDAWFGDYVSEPLNYFIGFPFFSSEAVEVYHGPQEQAEDLRRRLSREAGLVAWIEPVETDADAEGEPDESRYAILVRTEKRDAAAAFLEREDYPVVTDGERSHQGGLPFIVAVLLAGGLFFTLRFGLVHIRMFGHGLACIIGRYDDPRDQGEISHFQALSSALSATLGLGNIAGVAIAITLGGPGAVFWMWLSAFFGMSMKFCECTLSQFHRRFDRKGHVLGGPMMYIDEGLGRRGEAWRVPAKILAAAYAVIVICMAFGVALFQTKTSFGISEQVIPIIEGRTVAWGFGLALAVLVGIVIIGGIRRIGRVAAKLVPAMCVFYVSVCLIIILANLPEVPGLIGRIFTDAFTGPAIYGGFFGVLVMGMRRGMFSNEAGTGSAAIAHAAARTREPVREGLVAMVGPFLDTIVLCTMTALAILITAVHQGADTEGLDGAVLTADAFGTVHWIVKYLLVPAVLVFAYSTMISWSYYGDRAAEYLLGVWAVTPFRVIFVLLVVIGPLIGLDNVLAFADMMFFAAAIPNIIAMALLSGVVVKLLKDYQRRLASGEMQPAAAGQAADPAPAPDHEPHPSGERDA